MSLLQELRYAIRLMARNWGFSATVVLILALTIGANTAVLSVVNTALLAPLPYPQPGRLAQLIMQVKSRGEEWIQDGHTGATWEAVRDHASFLDVAVAGETSGVNMTTGASSRYVQQSRVGSGYFRVLGTQPVIGREFTADEDRPGGPPVAILSDAFWRQQFAADPQAVGRTLLLRGEPYTIIGVMPAGFEEDEKADLWTPRRPSRTGEGGGMNYEIIARLRPGVTWQRANSQLAVLSQDLKHDRNIRKDVDWALAVRPLKEGVTSDLRKPLFLLWAAVACVFLLGAVNIGGMLLARSSGRVGEIATRLALGAPLSRIVRQLLTESLALGLVGGVAAIAVGRIALAELASIGGRVFPILDAVSLDWRVMAATFFLTLIASLIFGVAPAWQASRVDIKTAQTGSRSVAGRKRFISLGGLVAGQVALTVPLLVGAGLLLHTFLHLWNLNPGFDGDNVLTASFSLQDQRYAGSDQVNVFYAKTLSRMKEIPGIESAAVTLSLPYERALNDVFMLPGKTNPDISNLTYVSPEFFDALRIPLLQGRVLALGDSADSEPVAIASQSFANKYFGGHAVGEVIRMGSKPVQIVGVVGDVLQQAGWGEYGPSGAVPTLYIPATQLSSKYLVMLHTWFSPNWIVRSRLPTAQVASAIERATRSVDPLLPIAKFRGLSEVKSKALDRQRAMAVMIATLGLLAALLAALGIYGLIANLVAERSRELGIRMALGSTVTQAIETAIRPGLKWVLAGVAAGAGVSWSFGKLIESFLYGVSSTDPLTLLGVTLGLVAVTALASLIPAARIARLNPADTLRAD